MILAATALFAAPAFAQDIGKLVESVDTGKAMESVDMEKAKAALMKKKDS
jgi:hypothetical protein